MCPLYEAVQTNDTKLSEQLGSEHGWNIKHILYYYNIPFKILYRPHRNNLYSWVFWFMALNIMIISNPLEYDAS